MKAETITRIYLGVSLANALLWSITLGLISQRVDVCIISFVVVFFITFWMFAIAANG